jgi:hypothetical protein
MIEIGGFHNTYPSNRIRVCMRATLPDDTASGLIQANLFRKSQSSLTSQSLIELDRRRVCAIRRLQRHLFN